MEVVTVDRQGIAIVENQGSIGSTANQATPCPVPEPERRLALCPLHNDSQYCEGTGLFCHARYADRYHHCEFYQGYLYRGIVDMKQEFNRQE